MKESRFEEFLRSSVKARGGIVVKVGVFGWPDDVVVMPKGAHGWIELKKGGEEPEPLQWARISSLKALGAVAEYHDSFAGIEDFCRRLAGEPLR